MTYAGVWLGTLNLNVNKKKYQANAKGEACYKKAHVAFLKCQCHRRQRRDKELLQIGED